MKKFKVTFYPDNKAIEVDEDKTILQAALSCGVYINSACGGDGVCGRCKVILRKGAAISRSASGLSPEDRRKQMVLACAATIHGDIEVEVPAESRVDFQDLSPRELKERLEGIYSAPEELASVSSLNATLFAHSPLATKLYLVLPPPDLSDRVSDLERIYRQIKKLQDLPVMQTGLANVKQLGELLRDADWKITVTLGKRNDTVEIVLIEPQDTSSRNYGFCFDIGTTTISCQLIDLNKKEILGSRASYNKQASFGSDVITRIMYAKEKDGLIRLHGAVTETMNQHIKELIKEFQIDLNDVTCVVCAGNTTMLHILMGIDPTYIRREPYVPTANFLPTVRAQEAGVTINPRGLMYCVPGVSSYVGGDTTAGVLSSGLYQQEEVGILIDIGTNGEICLGNKDFLISAAASAGPAFEGSGMSCGMRASRGAIQKVTIDPKNFDVAVETIGTGLPRGICGSGYISALAGMLRAGLIDKSGKLNDKDTARIRKTEEGKEFVLVFKKEADSSSDIAISEADIDNLKRAKAAIYSATSILVKHMDLDFSQVKKFFIAGGFGTYLDIDCAVAIGLLPDLERKKYQFIGNSALAGARSMLLSYQAIKLGEEIAKKITYFELSIDPGYMDEYVAALFFPHTDLLKFPSSQAMKA